MKEDNIFELNMLNSRAGELEQQIMMLDQQLQELKFVEDDLDSLSKEKQEEAFMPLNKDMFVRGSIADTKNVFVSVGSGIILKKDINGAKEMAERNEKKVSEVKEKLLSDIRKIVERMEELQN
jgi:prefoldin alpha subunit